MSAPMNRLSESLFQKSFAECSAEELRQLTAQYPYFAPAHFLLLKKYDPSTEEYRRQYQKAQLYFHDPVSFEFFLHRAERIIEQPAVTAPVEAAPEEPAAEVVTVSEPFVSPTSLEEHEIGITEEGEASELTEADADATDAPETPLPGLAAIDLQAPPEGGLSFEPYHAVDYFASQGIRLSQDDVPKDKFGKQLKSFTDWLKTMKRITPETGGAHDAKTEAGVENLADHSVKESDIVTESMAEVWVKQGNKRKAADIYRKLSLLHPAKSAYFADKINSLNA
ncbi:MAG: hypothetical protein EOP50_08330 [Sphingobacteriales bacterium]|nr:MAG: hypothetical protein EOP50_08330 [Sphingobacteriales bacterium]